MVGEFILWDIQSMINIPFSKNISVIWLRDLKQEYPVIILSRGMSMKSRYLHGRHMQIFYILTGSIIMYIREHPIAYKEMISK